MSPRFGIARRTALPVHDAVGREVGTQAVQRIRPRKESGIGGSVRRTAEFPQPLRRRPLPPSRRFAPSPSSRLLAPALVVLAVLLQIGYPLASGRGRAHLAVLIVAAFAAACVAHAATSRSPRTAVAAVVISAGLGFAAELIGVHSGYPFGRYEYSDVLGARVFGVPLIVALAWTMLAWPSAVVARRLVAGRLARVLVGAWALTAADLFLDPQLVALHAWRWSSPSPHLPGVATVPLTNYAGWLVVSLVLSFALQQVVGDGPDGPAIALYLWLWIGWTVAQVFYLHLRASAAWGFLAMGVVAVPLVRRLGPQTLSRRRDE